MSDDKEDASSSYVGHDDQSGSSLLLDDSLSLYEDAIDSTASSKTDCEGSKESMEQETETERLKSLKKTLDIFFDNRIREAESLVETLSHTCVNHSHVKMYFTAMSAMMTLDPVSVPAE